MSYFKAKMHQIRFRPMALYLRLAIFTVRRYALHGLRNRNSVRPSVRLSHSWTVSTWFDLYDHDFMVAPSF